MLRLCVLLLGLLGCGGETHRTFSLEPPMTTDEADNIRVAAHVWNATCGFPMVVEQPRGTGDYSVHVVLDEKRRQEVSAQIERDRKKPLLGELAAATIYREHRIEFYSIAVDGDSMYQIAIHEFGHMMGLPDSDDRADIMYGLADSLMPKFWPSEGDKAAMRKAGWRCP